MARRGNSDLTRPMFSSSISNEDGVSLLKLGFISENFHKAELTLHPWIRISFLAFPGRPKGLLFDLRCICLDLNFIVSPGWPGTQVHLALPPKVLGLKTCSTTTPSF